MRLLAGPLKNRNVLIWLVIGLFSCESSAGKDSQKNEIPSSAKGTIRLAGHRSTRNIAPKISCPLCKGKQPAGFVLWLAQDASYAALVVFNEDTNGDGKIEAKIGEHGELLADLGAIAWVNTFTQETILYDAFLGSDHSNRIAILKKENEIFAVNTASGIRSKLEGAHAEPDTSNPCLPSREAVLSADGDRVVYPTGPTSYRSLHLESKQSYDVNTAFLLWRARPLGTGEEVFEIIKDRDGGGMAFPKSQSTCACDWCPRFARSVGSYGSVGDEIRKSIYNKQQIQPEEKTYTGCKSIGKNEGAFRLLECNHTLFRVKKEAKVGRGKKGAKTRIPYKIKIPSYENPTLEGWFPVLVLGETGLHMGRYHVDRNALEKGPRVNNYAKKTHPSGFWLGRSEGKNIVWSLRSNRFLTIEDIGEVRTFDGLIANTKNGKYLVDGFTGATQKVDQTPSWSTANGCALFRKQTHRITVGPWELSCP